MLTPLDITTAIAKGVAIAQANEAKANEAKAIAQPGKPADVAPAAWGVR